MDDGGDSRWRDNDRISLVTVRVVVVEAEIRFRPRYLSTAENVNLDITYVLCHPEGIDWLIDRGARFEGKRMSDDTSLCTAAEE